MRIITRFIVDCEVVISLTYRDSRVDWDRVKLVSYLTREGTWMIRCIVRYNKYLLSIRYNVKLVIDCRFVRGEVPRMDRHCNRVTLFKIIGHWVNDESVSIACI